jgi:histone H3/H4
LILDGDNMAEEQVQEETQEDDSLPFPTARVVKILRSEIKDKQIRSEVKSAMNIWLGDLLKKIAKEMGNSQYATVGIADFQRATRAYDMIEDIVKDEERLLTTTEKLKQDADHIQREMKRFFETIKTKKD